MVDRLGQDEQDRCFGASLNAGSSCKSRQIGLATTLMPNLPLSTSNRIHPGGLPSVLTLLTWRLHLIRSTKHGFEVYGLLWGQNRTATLTLVGRQIHFKLETIHRASSTKLSRLSP